MTIEDDLETYYSLRKAIGVIKCSEQWDRDRLFTPEILSRMSDLTRQYAGARAPLLERLKLVEKIVITRVLDEGMTVKGTYVTAFLLPGHVVWNTQGLQALASIYPQILDFKKRTASTVVIRLNKGEQE